MRRLTVADEATIQKFHDRAAMALEAIKRQRREDCPRCTSSHCEIAVACSSRMDSDLETHGYHDGPMCKHVTREAQERADEEVTKARLSRMTRAGVPDPEMAKHLAKTRSMPQPPRAWFGLDQQLMEGSRNLHDAAHYFVSQDDIRSLILIGGTGTGKTTAASWIVATTLDNALWLPARTVDEIERWKQVSMLAYSVPLLVIDDLGTERLSEGRWGVDTLESLWVDRIDRGVRTIVTTNLAPGALAARYGDRLKSRMNRLDVSPVGAGTVDLRKLKREYQARMEGK